MSRANQERLRRYEALRSALERLLYEYDPDRMGSMVGAPLDEYSDVAISVIRAVRDRKPDDTIADAVRHAVPGATTDLVAEIEKLWNDSP